MRDVRAIERSEDQQRPAEESDELLRLSLHAEETAGQLRVFPAVANHNASRLLLRCQQTCLQTGLLTFDFRRSTTLCHSHSWYTWTKRLRGSLFEIFFNSRINTTRWRGGATGKAFGLAINRSRVQLLLEVTLRNNLGQVVHTYVQAV